jgi:nicotinate-nucleotide pyrophosphorylase (carboxylating)
VTAALVPAAAQGKATVVTREPAVVCGQGWFDACFAWVSQDVVVEWRITEGAWVQADTLLCEVRGPARALLTAERSALNFLQLLSGTATVTKRYVDAVAGTFCHILDTRKTLPGLRTAQKYATRCGGGHNHRLGLYDAILVKENHIAAAGSITAAINAARASARVLVEVEVETLKQLDEALAARPDMILLDNFPLDRLREAVKRNRAAGSAVKLEASGGITLENVRAVAETGVDFISVGATTKNVQAVDLSMRFEM